MDSRNIRLHEGLRPVAAKARSTRSTMMTGGPYNEVLRHASKGLEVDIHDLNRACMVALSSCATRGSTSAERRILAAEILVLADHVSDVLAGLDPRPVERPRQPVELSPDELQDWLRV